MQKRSPLTRHCDLGAGRFLSFWILDSSESEWEEGLLMTELKPLSGEHDSLQGDT